MAGNSGVKTFVVCFAFMLFVVVIMFLQEIVVFQSPKYVRSNEPNLGEVNVLNRLHKLDHREASKNYTTRLRYLQSILFKAIYDLQNPGNCDKAKKFYCDLGDTAIGFCGLVYLIVCCHLMAFGMNRTLILTNTHMENAGGLAKYFKPLSETCKKKITPDGWKKAVHIQDSKIWHGMDNMDNSPEVLKYKIWDGFSGPFPMFLPGTMPKSLRKELEKLHKQPDLWFLGQFTGYIMTRFQDELAKEINALKTKLDFKSPIVGVHIRHGNKLGNERFGAEANYIKEEKFMTKVKEYFDLFYPNVHPKRVYVATDNFTAMEKIFNKYKDKYKFITIPSISKHAQDYDKSLQYGVQVLKGIITDTLLLTSADFVVCTFTSNVGRLVYELK